MTRSRGGRPTARTLAYPGGAYNTAVMDAVRSEGSTWMAFTIVYGCSESWSTRLHEQRMIMRHDLTPASGWRRSRRTRQGEDGLRDRNP